MRDPAIRLQQPWVGGGQPVKIRLQLHSNGHRISFGSAVKAFGNCMFHCFALRASLILTVLCGQRLERRAISTADTDV